MNIFFFGATSFAAQFLAKDLALKNKIYFFSRKKEKKNFHFFELNKSNKKTFNNIKIKKIDYLFFFSSYVPKSELNSSMKKCLSINVYGLIRLLNEIKIPIKKIILSSSCSLYGSNRVKNKSELTHLMPDTAYSLSKYAQEKILEVYCNNNNIDFLSYRIGYVFGHNMHNKRLIKKLINYHFQNKKIHIYNKKLNLNLIHTKDISYLIQKTYKKSIGTFNLTYPKKITLDNFYRILKNKKTNIKEKNNFSSEKLFKKFPKINSFNYNKILKNFINEN